MNHKKCFRCNIEKSIFCFSINSSRKDGYSFYCRDCDYYLSKITRHNKWIQSRIDNGLMIVYEKKCEYCRELKDSIFFRKAPKREDGLYNLCLICATKINKNYVEGNHVKKREMRSILRELNKDIINNSSRDSYYRCKTPETRLKKSCSKAIRVALKKNGSNKDSSIFTYLPYTVIELKKHLESQFEDWMTWDNWGVYDSKKRTWQIDHIIPQSKLPYKSMKDDNFKKCWALSNLQPLETVKNIIKSNKC